MKIKLIKNILFLLKNSIAISFSLPGKGSFLISVDSEFNDMIIGVAEYLKYTFDMKYTDRTKTVQNIDPKNMLNSKIPIKILLTNEICYVHQKKTNAHRSKSVIVLSPTYFNPCKVLFDRNRLKLSWQVVLQLCAPLLICINRDGCLRWRITLACVWPLGPNILLCIPLELGMNSVRGMLLLMFQM